MSDPSPSPDRPSSRSPLDRRPARPRREFATENRPLPGQSARFQGNSSPDRSHRRRPAVPRPPEPAEEEPWLDFDPQAAAAADDRIWDALEVDGCENDPEPGDFCEPTDE